MQKETQPYDNSRYNHLIPLRIQVDPDSLTMTIESFPFYFFNLLAFFGIFFVTIYIFSINDDMDQATWIIGIILFWGWLIYSVFTKRTIRCWIYKNLSQINYFKSGVLSSSFDASEKIVTFDDVGGLRMQRHVRKYGDTFQVFLLLKDGSSLALSGADLNFEECQDAAEKIKNFIDPSLPVKAAD